MKQSKENNNENKKQNICFGKKAQTFKLMFWIFFEFALILIVLLYIVAIVHSYVLIEFDTGELQRELFVQNLLHSPDGISYTDLTSGKVYPGIINLDDFKNTDAMESKLKAAFSYGDRNPVITASMTLKDPNIAHYFLTDEGKIRPHIWENGVWTEKDVAEDYTADQATPFVYNGEEIQTVYYHKNWFERWLIIAETKYIGRGGFTEYETSKLVLARDSEGNLYNAVLEFIIVTPGRYTESD